MEAERNSRQMAEAVESESDLRYRRKQDQYNEIRNKPGILLHFYSRPARRQNLLQLYRKRRQDQYSGKYNIKYILPGSCSHRVRPENHLRWHRM